VAKMKLLCLLALILLVALVNFTPVHSVPSNAHDHSHSHDHNEIHHEHSHSHSHGHEHSHSHSHDRQVKPAPSGVKSEPKNSSKEYGVWSEALFATVVIGVAPILILMVVPLVSTDSKGTK
jgi:ABC-type Zn2+ transport system substrate-binding protein/surface adhesin